jgi:hypothetical protein
VLQCEAVSATFRFQLDSSVYINKLQIHANSTAAAGKSINIDRLGVELELTLYYENVPKL